jgi:cysteinyl-tRNA synthetase
MSKSLGNTIDVVQLAEYIPAVILRIALLSTHYRHPLPWTAEKLQQSEKLWFKILDRIQGAKYKRSGDTVPSQEVLNALCEDLNTPLAFTRLLELSDEELFYTVDFLGLFDSTFFPAKASYEEIDNHVKEYRVAREQKDYSRSDELRERLLEEGVHVRANYSWFCGLPKNYERFFNNDCEEGCEGCSCCSAADNTNNCNK